MDTDNSGRLELDEMWQVTQLISWTCPFGPAHDRVAEIIARLTPQPPPSPPPFTPAVDRLGLGPYRLGAFAPVEMVRVATT
jgi:hypothetical protein